MNKNPSAKKTEMHNKTRLIWFFLKGCKGMFALSILMAAISALLVFLEKGAQEIASKYQLSDYVADMVKGIILFFLLGSEFFVKFKVKMRGHKESEE